MSRPNPFIGECCPYMPDTNVCVSCGLEHSDEELLFAQDQYTGLSGWVCKNGVDDYGLKVFTSLAKFKEAS